MYSGGWSGYFSASHAPKPPASYRSVQVRDLLALYWGDEDSCGYQQAEIIVRVAELVKPSTEFMLKKEFYADPAEDMDEDVQLLFAEAWLIYQLRQQLQK